MAYQALAAEVRKRNAEERQATDKQQHMSRKKLGKGLDALLSQRSGDRASHWQAPVELTDQRGNTVQSVFSDRSGGHKAQPISATKKL